MATKPTIIGISWDILVSNGLSGPQIALGILGGFGKIGCYPAKKVIKPSIRFWGMEPILQTNPK